jgi:hypothetical protein
MSPNRNAGQNLNKRVDNNSFENMGQFRNFRTTITKGKFESEADVGIKLL